MAHVLLEGISKHFGTVSVIERLDLRIEDREFLVLVGPSGCGKSTLLRLIAGLEELTAGTIRIGGRVVNDVAPKDRDIAMVFQSYALHPHMSFLGGAAHDTWGYIVAVSGPELEERLDFRGTLGLRETPPDRLMILPIAPGCRRESFGGGRQDDPLQPPLVDVIVPAGTAQETVLKDHDIQAKRPVGLEGVVPAASAAAASRPTR
jgi:hypothetical protein